MNVSNGGLIAQLNGNLYVCDLHQYSGTRVFSSDGVSVWDTHTMMWFAASDGHGIYCSNQRDYDFLTYIDGKTMTEKRLLDKACANLIVHNDRVLYIDEEDGLVYAYDPVKEKSALVINEKVFSFILSDDSIFYTSESGLKRFDYPNGRTDKLKECFPVCLNYSVGRLIFADKRKAYVLCCYDMNQNRLEAYDNIRTQSVITTGEYIFASHLSDSNSIVRVSLLTGESIRFCGERADKLHIIEEHLYFLNQNDNNAWYRIPIAGGRPMRCG